MGLSVVKILLEFEVAHKAESCFAAIGSVHLRDEPTWST
jgi:hypothetical protein